MTDRTQIYQDASGGWRWRRLSPNNEIIADSGEAYTREADAERTAARVFEETDGGDGNEAGAGPV